MEKQERNNVHQFQSKLPLETVLDSLKKDEESEFSKAAKGFESAIENIGGDQVDARLNQAQIDLEGLHNFIVYAQRNGLNEEINMLAKALEFACDPSVQSNTTEMQLRITVLKDAGNLLRETLSLEEFITRHGTLDAVDEEKKRA